MRACLAGYAKFTLTSVVVTSPQILSRSVTPLGAFLGVFSSFWMNRSLIKQLVRRDFESRFRGSVLGIFWALLQPLCLLVVYTFVFSQVFQARWSAEINQPMSFALILFSGLIAFNLFAENFNSAPRMVLHNVSYIKRVVFPLEVLPWVALLSALVTACISSMLLLVFYFVFFGIPPLTILYIPLVCVPLCLGTLGAVWFISSVGVFLRDIQHGTALVSTVLMFLSPVFYPISAVPLKFQRLIGLNPLAKIIEMIRGALFFGDAPGGWSLIKISLVSWCFAAAGYWWFMRIRKGFADVV